MGRNGIRRWRRTIRILGGRVEKMKGEVEGELMHRGSGHRGTGDAWTLGTDVPTGAD
jgi:hypothetical protein